MTDRRLILAGGVLTSLVTIQHLLIPLGWGDVLDGLSRNDRATMYELAIGLSIMFAIMAYVSLRHSSELVSTPLGHAILAGFAVGWLVRGVEGFLFGETGAAVIAAVCVVAVVLYGTPLVRAYAHRRDHHPDVGARTEPKTPALR